MKKGVLKNFAIFMETSMWKSLFNKLVALQANNFMKKRLQHRCFPVSIARSLRIPILKNICKWLLLQWSFLSLVQEDSSWVMEHVNIS